MSLSESFNNTSSTLTMEQYDLFKRIIRLNMSGDRVARGVTIRIARMRKKFGCDPDHKAALDFARAEQSVSRTVRAVNLIAEKEGCSGRLVDTYSQQSMALN